MEFYRRDFSSSCSIRLFGTDRVLTDRRVIGAVPLIFDDSDGIDPMLSDGIGIDSFSYSSFTSSLVRFLGFPFVIPL